MAQYHKIHEMLHQRIDPSLTAAGEDERLCRMNGNAADVIRVRLKLVDPLQGVVVERSDVHVILMMKESIKLVYNNN